MSGISFGTSGWRAILLEDFTFANVRIAVQAIAGHLQDSGHCKQGVLVSYDGRFAAERFASLACEVLAGYGIPSFLTRRDTPTPAVALEQRRRKLDGAINFTASHNPPEYGGLKFNPHWGGPATKDITADIERRAAAIEAQPSRGACFVSYREARQRGLVQELDALPAYLRRLAQLVDLQAIRKAKLRVVVDPMHGAGRGCTEALLRRAGAAVSVLHAERDPLFGGGAPDPSEGHLDALVREVRRQRAHLGLATDGDGDRFGIVDQDGQFLQPNLVLAMLTRYLHRTRAAKWDGAVLRSVVSSHFIDAAAQQAGREVVELPVGFKWIGQYMQTKPILIAGEESGGLTVHRHVPEKDGPLACLLMAELRAVERRPLKEVLREMYRELGTFAMGQQNFHLGEAAQAALRARLDHNPPQRLAELGVEKHSSLDGHKFVFKDGSWLAVRFSGTEPLVRLYVEAGSRKRLEALRQAGSQLIEG